MIEEGEKQEEAEEKEEGKEYLYGKIIVKDRACQKKQKKQKQIVTIPEGASARAPSLGLRGRLRANKR
jgi:disulfide oxidoreductase YuzD